MNWLELVGEHRDWRRVTLVFGILMMVWGGYALLPFSSFATVPSYDVLAHMAPEWLWGLTFLLVGCMKVWAAARRRHRWLMWLSLVAVFLWAALGIGVLAATPGGFGGPTYLAIGLLSATTYLSGLRCHVSPAGRCNGEAEAYLLGAAERYVAHEGPWGDAEDG